MINDKKLLIEFINNNLTPQEKEKKQYGEVFTPLVLIEEMLDKLDYYYKQEHNISIFENENLTWFDPASGIGNFQVCIFYRLFDGLKEKIPDEDKRKKHILEKMIYVSELNPKNVYIYKLIFKGFELNINEGNSLELNIKKKFGIDKFDIIIGNPPFNNGIWKYFVNFSLNNLIDNGYLLFIHPGTYRYPPLMKNLLKFDILFLNIFDDSASKIIFENNVEVQVDIYILKKSITDNLKTKIISNIDRLKIKNEINFLNIKNLDIIINCKVLTLQ